MYWSRQYLSIDLKKFAAPTLQTPITRKSVCSPQSIWKLTRHTTKAFFLRFFLLNRLATRSPEWFLEFWDCQKSLGAKSDEYGGSGTIFFGEMVT